ncbi:single-stranded DNA-binding protein [bacterium]|nr:single-stranded DNA-binding protein [bacterium]
MDFDRSRRTFCTKLRRLKFSEPTAYVYNPLEYACASYNKYLDQFAQGKKKALFLGMNPGPYGMAQTGIPFGEISLVRDWMGICEPLGKLPKQHPKRPLQGFQCEKSEVSGRRLWGLFSEKFPKPKQFFKDHMVLNYCPLVFMEESGRNRTPDKLPAEETEPLFAICDDYLDKLIKTLEPRYLIGVGAFAQKQLQRIRPGSETFKILHPSPASPAANRGWAEAAQKQLMEIGVW